MKLKTFSWITLGVGLAFSVIGFTMPFYALRMPAPGTAGIIGGADGPTYKFLMYNWLHGLPLVFVLFGVALVVTALFCFLFRKTVRKCCHWQTSLTALSLSAVGGAGLVCALECFTIAALSSPTRYPVAYPLSLAGGSVALVVFLVLIAWYFAQRSKRWSFRGVVIDVLTSILYLFSFSWTFICLVAAIR